jgi:hypothetical protein
MKKFLFICALAPLVAGCFPLVEEYMRYDSVWRVKNSTSQTLSIAPSFDGAGDHRTILPGDSVVLYSRREYDYHPNFENMMVRWQGFAEEDILFDVHSADGERLVRWEFRENGYDYPRGRQFFTGESWAHHTDYDNSRRQRDEWTFEILPRDIE